MRTLAFLLLASAAFDLGVPFLDRAGLAAAGVAFLALALPRPARRIRRAALPSIAPKTVELPAELDEPIADLAQRIRASVGDGARP